MDKRTIKHYDWKAIQKYYDEGYVIKDCIYKFGFNRSSWDKAVKRGDTKARPLILPIEDYIKKYSIPNSKADRGSFKRRLIKEGILKEICSECGLKNYWNNQRLVLVIDHVNGINNDYRIKNIRLLCPNCDSQQSTFAGRNVKKFKNISG